MAAKKIKQIKESNRHNTMHKRYQYNINQIKKIQHNNLKIAKVDKSKAIVIIDKTTLVQKIDTFIQENNIMKLNSYFVASQGIPRIYGTRKSLTVPQVPATFPCPQPKPSSPIDHLQLPEGTSKTYTVQNSNEMAQELQKVMPQRITKCTH
jgi:hypothetical protein